MFFSTLCLFIFPVKPLGPDTVSPVPPLPQNSTVVLIMMRAKNQSNHSWASQVGGAKWQKTGLGTVMILILKKTKQKSLHGSSFQSSARLPLFFLLLPTETNYFTRSLSSIFISRALQRWGERQMPRFSAWLSPLSPSPHHRHFPPHHPFTFPLCLRFVYVAFCCHLLFFFSLLFFSKWGHREAVWTHGETLA